VNGLGYGYWGSFTAKEQRTTLLKSTWILRAAYLRWILTG